MLNHLLTMLAVSPSSDITATADEVLSPYIYVFIVSWSVAFVMTPVMQSIAMYYHIIDEPDLVRKLHSAPVAYLGGVAVFLGWLAGLAVTQYLHVHRIDPKLFHLHVPVSIVIASSMIVILGLFDDIHKTRPWIKIGTQVCAALVLLANHIGTHCTEVVLAPLLSRINIYPTSDPQLYRDFMICSSGLLVIGLVVGCCNATNLMDGLDGLCGGVTAVIAGGYVFLAINMATFGGLGSVNTEGIRVVLALALLGGALGFLPYNFNPASIFLGDTGSMFIGFACATMIALMADARPKWFLASMVMFALPVLDTLLALARRWVNRRPIFAADRHHFHHQLVARGFSVKQTVVISYGLAIFFAVLGSAIVYMRTRYAVCFYLVIFGSIVVAAYKMGMVHEKTAATTLRSIGAEAMLNTGSQVDSAGVLEVKPASQPYSSPDNPTATA
jgi:UDP-GlcNAc:undecaprenyl-phosphate/decaprenyl-phosphate GlcNAc-1-phosphate transferase